MQFLFLFLVVIGFLANFCFLLLVFLYFIFFIFLLICRCLWRNIQGKIDLPP